MINESKRHDRDELSAAYLITGGIENRINPIKILTTSHAYVLRDAPEKARYAAKKAISRFGGNY